MLKAEVGDDLSPSVSTADSARFIQLLSNKQQELAAMWDWPFLRQRPQVTMVGGTRFYTLPSAPAINYDRPHYCQVSWNEIWMSMEYGIRETDYNLVDSTTTPPQANDPVQKWMITSATQFEVWPVPVTAQIVQFTSYNPTGALVNLTDPCVLDDLLLVLSVAAGELARRKSSDAPIMIQRANARMVLLRAAGPTRDNVFTPGCRKDLNHKSGRKVLL